MNAIWLTTVIVCSITLLFSAPESILSAFLSGAKNGVDLALTLLPVYVVWSGIVGVMDACELSDKISALISPLIKKLFPKESNQTHKLISMNLSCNLLGAGGAATPLGIRAIHSMQEGNRNIVPSAVLFTVINTTSIQLIPSTVISLLTEAGASAPYSIILPTIIISTLSTLLAVLLWSVFCMKQKEH